LPDETTSARIGGALVRMADLLYVIRSNLQHGEKFASTDPARIARDRVIAEKAAAVFELFFDLLFARPSTALAVYGSLAPGGVHHDQLDSIVGEWMQGAVRGRFRDGPFPRLDPTPVGHTRGERLPARSCRRRNWGCGTCHCQPLRRLIAVECAFGRLNPYCRPITRRGTRLWHNVPRIPVVPRTYKVTVLSSKSSAPGCET
jgi:hypothetical protein